MLVLFRVVPVVSKIFVRDMADDGRTIFPRHRTWPLMVGLLVVHPLLYVPLPPEAEWSLSDGTGYIQYTCMYMTGTINREFRCEALYTILVTMNGL